MTHLRGELPPIDLDGIEMRWASQWNESDDGEVRAWRADVAALIDEVHRLRRVSNGYFEEMVRRGESLPARSDAGLLTAAQAVVAEYDNSGDAHVHGTINRLRAALAAADHDTRAGTGLDVERLYRAIVDELVALWGEPSDAISTQVRPIVARSIANRYAADHDSGDGAGLDVDAYHRRLEAILDDMDSEPFGLPEYSERIRAAWRESWPDRLAAAATPPPPGEPA